MIHYLKIWPEHFDAVRRGNKRCEIRRADRPYFEGDQLCLREWNPLTQRYSERVVWVRVTHVLEGGTFGLDSAFCALSILRVS